MYVYPIDGGDGDRQQGFVACPLFGFGVASVEHQRKTNVSARTSKVMHFEPLDQLDDICFIGHQGRYHDQATQRWRYAVPQLESGQCRGAEARRHGSVYQRRCEVTRSDGRRKKKRAKPHRRARSAMEAPPSGGQK